MNQMQNIKVLPKKPKVLQIIREDLTAVRRALKKKQIFIDRTHEL